MVASEQKYFLGFAAERHLWHPSFIYWTQISESPSEANALEEDYYHLPSDIRFVDCMHQSHSGIPSCMHDSNISNVNTTTQ